MRYILLLFGILHSSICYSQQDANWCFGDSLGIHFQNGQRTLFPSAMSTLETSAVLSDSNNKLLLYCGGLSLVSPPYAINLTCFDSSMQVLINGVNINGLIYFTNGAILLPAQQDSVYLIHLGRPPGLGNIYLYYSLISKINNSWQIISKNNLLCDSTFHESILAIKHANGRDWWITGRLRATDKFTSFLLSPSGISGAFFQVIGSVNNYFFNGGQFIVNRNGNKVVISDDNGTLELYDFDRCTGLYSNYLPLYTATSQSQYNLFYGCSFSPSGRFLYVSTTDSLMQFDLMAPNILSTQVKLFQTPDSTRLILQHSLAPDQRIYISNYSIYSNVFDSLTTHLSVINDPDQPGVMCNFQPYSFSLGGRRSFGGLPNLPNFSLGPVSGSICDSLSATSISDAPKIEHSLKISPQPASGFIALSFDQPIAENLICRITDNLGSTKLMANETSKSGLCRLDLSMIPTGLYTLEVTNENGKKLFKKLLVVK